MLDWRGQLAAGAVALLLAIGAAIRRRLKSGKRVLPRVRMRTYFSFRTPESDPPPHELRAEDLEIIPAPPPSSPPDDFDARPTDRPTPDIRTRRRRP